MVTTLSVVANVTPTVLGTCANHVIHPKENRGKPTSKLSYDLGLHLIKKFLQYISYNTVEEAQQFTDNGVPNPHWVRVERVSVEKPHLDAAAKHIQGQLGPHGIEQVGGKSWWQWRRNAEPLSCEFVEMRKDYNTRKRTGDDCKRCMLYVHGGAYYFASVPEHRYQLQRHARKLQARVFAPSYRLAPQYPFPAGLMDCIAAYLYLLTVQKPETIILAGDSAGGGMVLAMLIVIRDQGLPMPAGSVLISPWSDLSHSFPSVGGDNPLDYIPAHGFFHKPSMSWPPPSMAELQELLKDQSLDKKGPYYSEILKVEVDGKVVELREQVQLYCPNSLIKNPLVSPVLQPSLGGFSPILVLVGGGEVLRDEQIYVAHKAADPSRYPPSEATMDSYPGAREEVDKYPPTNVQLQVWDDLCHVTTTLAFTPQAKLMFRSIAQFGAWALARAQKTEINIIEDDQISNISDDSASDNMNNDHADSKEQPQGNSAQPVDMGKSIGLIGRAGDPLPPFVDNMIRQRVNIKGEMFPLAAASTLPACTMNKEQVGVVGAAPLGKWLRTKKEMDTRFARQKRNVQRKRLQQIAEGGVPVMGETREYPPPTAWAGMREKDLPKVRKFRMSKGLAIWTVFGSKHDENAVEREEELEKDSEETVTVSASGERPKSKSRMRGVSYMGQISGEPAHTTQGEKPSAELGDTATNQPEVAAALDSVARSREDSIKASVLSLKSEHAPSTPMPDEDETAGKVVQNGQILNTAETRPQPDRFVTAVSDVAKI